MAHRRSFVASFALALAAPLAAQQFTAGDAYLYSSVHPLTPSQSYSGIVRVDPATGVVTPFWTAPTAVSVSAGRAAYDPFRDRIVLAQAQLDGVNVGVYALDAAANWTLLGASPVTTIAPRGDGLLYGTFHTGAPNYQLRIGYLDVANGSQTLLDTGGGQPWSLFGGLAVFGGQPTLVYEPTENALFLAIGGNGAQNCAGVVMATNSDVVIHKLPLTADGAALRAPATCTTFSVIPHSNGFETPLQWSYGPAGDLVLSVQTNQAGLQPRLLRVTPATLAVTPFAQVGAGFPNDVGFDCGAYSPLHGHALIWDGYGDRFRAILPGSSGLGTPLASYGNAGSSGQSQLFVVGPIGPSVSLLADVYALSTSAGGVQAFTYTPGPAFAGDSYLIVGTLSGWWPGLPLGNGLVLPINFDFLTDLSLQLQNTPILTNTAGIVPVSGQIQASFTLPPGLLTFLSGWKMHFAGLSYQSLNLYTQVSNPVPLSLLP